MTEFCLWDDEIPDDMTIGNLANEIAAEKRRKRHARDTDRRGGLKAIAEKASLEVFGMPLAALDREAAKTMPSRERLQAAYDAIRVVAGYDPDWPAPIGWSGFNLSSCSALGLLPGQMTVLLRLLAQAR